MHVLNTQMELTPVLALFAGKVLHSHSYRYAELFSGQSVVVLGAKASGLDISIELAKAGAQVTNADVQHCAKVRSIKLK